MENDINDGVILAARLLLAALFLIFGWRKLTDYSRTVTRMVQDGARFPVLATPVAIFMELPVAFAVAVGAFTRLSALLLVFYTLGNRAHCASLLDNDRCEQNRQHGKLLQKPQYYGRLSAALHHRCGKIFDRCHSGIVRGLFFQGKSPKAGLADKSEAR
jgi:DoxX-like protein